MPTVEEYIQEHLEKGEKLGFDGRVMGASRALAFAKAAEENGASLSTEEDLIGEIWADRPEVPDADLFVLEEKWSGETTDKKLARVRKAMEEKGAAKLSDTNRGLITVITLIAALVLSRVGVVTLIEQGYSYLSYGFILFYLLPTLLVGGYKIIKHKDK